MIESKKIFEKIQLFVAGWAAIFASFADFRQPKLFEDYAIHGRHRWFKWVVTHLWGWPIVLIGAVGGAAILIHLYMDTKRFLDQRFNIPS